MTLEKEYQMKKKKFTELNIDSLDSFTIILELSEKLNVDFPEEQISKFKSIQDITDYLNSINHSI